MDNHYINYISLGYFCGIAQDLEKLGLRNQSSPFDWGISYFQNVIDAIDKEFEGFMDYENLYQSVNIREHYCEKRYNFYFFHDFSKYKSLKAQYAAVKEKYDRRIKRFLQNIKSPTLFVRYISTEELDEGGRSEELNWLEENYDYVMSVLKRFNPQNSIIFIGDETVKSEKIKIYSVHRDKEDKVSRSPICNNKELFPIFSAIQFPGKAENIERVQKKLKRKTSYKYKIKSEIIIFFQNVFLKEYKHSKIYDIANR